MIRALHGISATSGIFSRNLIWFSFCLDRGDPNNTTSADGISKSSVTAFALTFLAYNFKPLWAPMVDSVSLPLIGKYGQRRSWLWFVSSLLICAIFALGLADPRHTLAAVAISAVAVGVFGATLDIVIDAYRIELLKPSQLGVGSGMSQYGWRIALPLRVHLRF